ncbi:MAG: toprim domain-containing protein, partial [Desulfovibrio sp.]|nr:toprim domain-containing protein [Desulfovibrio sp.]
MNSDIEAAALAELRAHGLELDSVQWDMGIVRCATTGKPHGKDGAYSAHSDNPACIWWQNYPSGTDGVWTVKGLDKLSAAEQEALARRMDETRKAREAEQSRVHAEAAEQAQAIYAAAKDCTGHAYLSNKGVKPVPGLKVGTDSYGNEGALLIPIYNEAGETVSLQSIPATPGANGKWLKLFLKGGRKRGCFFSIGEKSVEKPLLIAEGLATGLSLYECLTLPVLTAFDAGNLRHVAELARRKYPDRQIILCADYDDPSNQVPQAGGVGLKAATEAALAVGGFVATPRLSGRKVDWNDLHQKMGIAEVALQFQTCHKPEPPKPKTDTLPEGFVLRSDGLFHIEQKEDAAPVETWLGPPL